VQSRFSFQLHLVGDKEDVSIFKLGYFGFEQSDEGCRAGVSEGFVVGEVVMGMGEVEVVAKEGGHGSPEEEEVLQLISLFLLFFIHFSLEGDCEWT